MHGSKLRKEGAGLQGDLGENECRGIILAGTVDMPPCSLQTIENDALMSGMMFPSTQRQPGALYFGKSGPNEL
jgi:hypothetical protein